ncbi:FAD-binding oxidoreductase [Burkholderia anthina]|uniref:FAD-binding oxidoreductase n=1 Tax=Burkholderia anthina TaxID=179879 RepID=UPI0015888124
MSEKRVHTVRFEPVGVEMEVEEGEWVLDAAFRQGIAVMHGCREGQCSSCKCVLLDGDAEVQKYSTFALPDYERDTGHILLCRTYAYSDITVELLNYDEDVLSRSIAVKEFQGKVVGIKPLTHDIRLLQVELDEPLKFWAGQFVELTVPGVGIMRSYSMANTPSDPTRLEFIIKKYPDGAFSSLLDGSLEIGTPVQAKGPYGGCFRREGRQGPLILVGGGSGMSPLWSILNDHVQSGEKRPVRFFYGARNRSDLFYLEQFAELEQQIDDFRFIPALSQPLDEDAWNGETGYIHDVVERTLRAERLEGEMDAFSCGPPPMIDALLPVLQRAGVAPEHIYFDKFTPAAR